MFKKIPKIAVYVALAMIPLFTLPFSSNYLDFQKQFLLFLVAGIGFFFWVWMALSEKKLEINLNPLHFFVLAFAAVALVASLFSLYGYGSLWGNPLPVAESFLSVLSFIFLYLLVSNNFKKEEAYGLIAIVAVSGAIAAAYAILQSFGLYLLPFLDYTKNQSFNTIGTITSLALFSSIVVATMLPLIFSNKNRYRLLMMICGAIMLASVIIFNGAVTVYFPTGITGVNVDFALAPWIVLAAGVLATFIFSVNNTKSPEKGARVKNISFALLFLSLIFIIFNVFAKDMVASIYKTNTGSNNQIMEAVLRQQTAAEISINVLKQSSQAFFLGSGPGTFVYDYIKFKPQSANQDSVGWNLIFYAGSSEIINRVATTGILGLIAFLLIIGMWTAESFRSLTGDENEPDMPLAIFGGWVAIVVALFYYPFNVSLWLLFWLFLGLIITLDQRRFTVVSLRSMRLSYAISLIFVIVTVLELGLLVWNTKRYYAEVEYMAAAKALQKNDLVGAIRYLESAANSTERLQDNYLTGLSSIYLAQAKEELNKQGANPQDAFQAAAPYLRTAVNAAMLSTDAANPSNSANWAQRGYIYRQLIGVSDGFDTWALNMYQKALTLEPNNPTLWNEVGQVYAKRNEIDKAKESFSKAIALRPQYIDPHYYLALIFDQQGDKDNAVKELESVYVLLPATDTQSRDNVAKAIQNLKDGKSLTGSGNQPPAEAPDQSQSVPPAPADGSASTSTIPAGVQPEAPKKEPATAPVTP